MFLFSISLYFLLSDNYTYLLTYYWLPLSSFLSFPFYEITILFCDPFSKFLPAFKTGDSSLFYDKEVSKWVFDVTGAMFSLWSLGEVGSWWSESD